MLDTDEDYDAALALLPPLPDKSKKKRQKIAFHFVMVSFLFSINNASTVSCFQISSTKYGNKLGPLEMGTIITTYAITALLGVTYITKTLGSRNAMIIGMALNCLYELSPVIAQESVAPVKAIIIVIGSMFGGLGVAMMWTAQGVYFSQSCDAYYQAQGPIEEESDYRDRGTAESDRKITPENISSRFAGIFGCIFCVAQILMIAGAVLTIEFGKTNWISVYSVYIAVSIVTAGLMMKAKSGSRLHDIEVEELEQDPKPSWMKGLDAIILLLSDRKMKYFIMLGITSGVTNRYVFSLVSLKASQLPPLVNESQGYTYLFSCIPLAIQAVCCIIFGYGDKYIGKGTVIIIGYCSYSIAALMLLLKSDKNMVYLIFIFVFSGIGNATFRGTLRAVFADYFPHEKDGAFANLTFQEGCGHFLAWVISEGAVCAVPDTYCSRLDLESKKTVHALNIILLVFSILAVPSFLRAYYLFREEKNTRNVGPVTFYGEDS